MREFAVRSGARLALKPGETLVLPVGVAGSVSAGDDVVLTLSRDGVRLVLEGFLASLRKGDTVAVETEGYRIDSVTEAAAMAPLAMDDESSAIERSGSSLTTAPVFESTRLDRDGAFAPVGLAEIVRAVVSEAVPEVARSFETGADSSSRKTQTALAPAASSPVAPTLVVAPAAGAEDSAVALAITASPNHAGDIVTVTIAGVPTGTSLSAGRDLGGGTWSLTQAELAGLTMQPPVNQATGIALTVTATATSGGQTATTAPSNLTVTTTPVPDAVFTAGDDTVDLSGADITVPTFVNPWAQDGNRSNALGGNDVVTLASSGANALAAGTTFLGGTGNDTITGGTLADIIDGDADADALSGGDSADTLIGGDGADRVDGGLGDDVLIVASSTHFDPGESLIGGLGFDTLRFTSVSGPQILTFVAGAPPSGIEVFAIADASGATTGTTALSLDVAASASAVTLIGNDGNNTLTATAGADTIVANAGVDTVFAGGGADNVDLGIGDDVLAIMSAAEHGAGEALAGGAGTDTIRFASTTAGETLALLAATTGFEAVAIASAAGSTIGTTSLNLDASMAANGLVLTGNNGSNTITGTGFADTIFANSGNDVIVIASVSQYATGESLNGGAGTDTVRFASTTDGQTLTFAGGMTSLIEIAAIADALGGAGGTARVNIDASALTGIMTITGNEGSNTLIGTSGVTTLLGNGGDDTIVGGDGADRLEGGAGDDVFLLASPGHFDAGELIAGGLGFDTFRFTTTSDGWTLTLPGTTTGLERVMLSDDQGVTAGTTVLSINATSVTAGLEITGNDGVNQLIGTGFVDVIQGNGDADSLTGRGGADTLTGGAGSDDFIYHLLSEAGDRILDFDFDTSTTQVDRLAFQDDAFGGAGIDIGDADEIITFSSGNDAALNLAGTEFGVKTDATVANDQATVQSLIDSFTNVTTGALFLISDGTDAHVWFDPNPSVVGGAVEVAALVGQNLASLSNVDASDIRVI